MVTWNTNLIHISYILRYMKYYLYVSIKTDIRFFKVILIIL